MFKDSFEDRKKEPILEKFQGPNRRFFLLLGAFFRKEILGRTSCSLLWKNPEMHDPFFVKNAKGGITPIIVFLKKGVSMDPCFQGFYLQESFKDKKFLR